MNPSSTPYPHPNSYLFPFPPQNPNPASHFFFHSVSQLPPPPLTTATAQNPDLSATLSSLTDLLSLSDQALDSLSSLLYPKTTSSKPENVNLVSCPYNPHHLMPPESLFFHSLRCPISLFEDPTSLVDSLHYPKTLNMQNPDKNFIAQSVQDSDNAELCFSLDGYFNEFRSNFFYKDCPGVVNSNDLENSNKTFTLPAVLSVECANFVGNREGDIKCSDKRGFRVLPSDLWAIRREVEGWVDYPNTYSYGVFCSILQLNVIKFSNLRKWIIANSPRYGVVIDVYMTDHIYVLFRLCLKAIRREALSAVGNGMNMKTLSFSCPVLGQVLMWITSQLSFLYGEMKAKCFAIHICRECVLDVAGTVLFPLDNDSDARDAKFGEPLQGIIECNVGKEMDESADVEVIFVSQVASSVAALHERSLLEAKINRVRMPQSLPRHQRKVEHDYVSKRADEERKKRSNYKAIIDHDGLPSRYSSKQEASKTKTREELLAEERDYKRRRMSYRGKKLKRTTLQVMRDIIDEYMEEIKQAGGIGCFEKAAEEERMSPRPPSAADIAFDVNEVRKSHSNSSEAIRSTPNHYENHLHSDHSIRSTTPMHALHQYSVQKGRDHNRHHEQVEYPGSAGRDRHGREFYSGSQERHRSGISGRSRHYGERDDVDVEMTTTKHHDKRSSKANYETYKSSHSLPNSAKNSGVKKDGEQLADRDRHVRNLYGNHSSNVISKNEFEDRYNPAESHDVNEGGVYSGDKYETSKEFHE